MKSFTKRYKNYYNEKYPIISSKTGKKYLVSICPYYEDDAAYRKGCIVRLYDGNPRIGVLYNNRLMEIYCDNVDGKIVETFPRSYVNTDYTYDLINLSKYIVNRYETEYGLDQESISILEKDFENFKKWDGVV